MTSRIVNTSTIARHCGPRLKKCALGIFVVAAALPLVPLARAQESAR